MALLLGPVAGHARGMGRMGPAYSPNVSSITIPSGTTVGPQTLPSGGSLINNGTIAGGSNTAITSFGPSPTSITNNGSITSSTGGIAASGGSSSITNNGSIDVQNSVNSSNATVGLGISQTTGP
jgi:hypothetical protein